MSRLSLLNDYTFVSPRGSSQFTPSVHALPRDPRDRAANSQDFKKIRVPARSSMSMSGGSTTRTTAGEPPLGPRLQNLLFRPRKMAITADPPCAHGQAAHVSGVSGYSSPGRQCTGSGSESAQGAAHEENKRENPQQVVHRIVHAALGEQCEDGRSVREVGEDRRSVRDVKQIRLWQGAPAWKSSRPRQSADREGCARNAESECQSDSENPH